VADKPAVCICSWNSWWQARLLTSGTTSSACGRCAGHCRMPWIAENCVQATVNTASHNALHYNHLLSFIPDLGVGHCPNPLQEMPTASPSQSQLWAGHWKIRCSAISSAMTHQGQHLCGWVTFTHWFFVRSCYRWWHKRSMPGNALWIAIYLPGRLYQQTTFKSTRAILATKS